MSEHTLDDLAARLEALGYRNGDLVPHDDSMCVSRFVQDDDGERTMVISAYRPRENWPSGAISLVEHDETTENSYRITATLTPNDIQALSLIRQWQASAEPAPPVVTDEDHVAVILSRKEVFNWLTATTAQLQMDFNRSSVTVEDEKPLLRLQNALAKALAGSAALHVTDLAPEGARDGQ